MFLNEDLIKPCFLQSMTNLFHLFKTILQSVSVFSWSDLRIDGNLYTETRFGYNIIH